MKNNKHIRFDWAMKRMLRNKANFSILEGFLSELLKMNIHIEEILESESNKEKINSKYNRVDILVKDDDKNYMLIEVQNEKQNDYFHRMLFGQAKLISERLKSGDFYGQLTRIYSINIVYFPLGAGNDYVYISNGNFIGMHTKDILQLSQKQKKLYKVNEVKEIFTQYYILKVNIFNDIAKDKLDEWIYFLKNNEIKDNFTAKGLAEAKEKLRIDSLSDSEKEEYENYIHIERIRGSEIETAYTDGIFDAEKKYKKKLSKAQDQVNQEREVRKQAEAQAKQAENEALKFKRNLVIKLHDKGFSYSEIHESTNIPIEDINKIISEIK